MRFVGLMNAAVWLGAGVFFTCAVGPAVFAPGIKRVIGDAQAGLVAQLLLERYFVVQYCCGAVALLHQLAAWVYLGRPLQRLTLGVVLGVLGLALLGGLALQPKMRRLHEVMYAYRKVETGYVRNDAHTPAQRQQAVRAFRVWHGVSMSLNVVALLALTWFAWRAAHPADAPRFIPAGKFRS